MGSDFRRAELLSMGMKRLVEWCMTIESLNAEKIDKIDALQAQVDNLTALIANGGDAKTILETNAALEEMVEQQRERIAELEAGNKRMSEQLAWGISTDGKHWKRIIPESEE